jgi:Protein of unknown function (DUF3108)
MSRLSSVLTAIVVLLLGSALADELAPRSIPFGVGERLTYAVKYKFITAGMATMEVKDTVDCNGSKCYRICSQARSTMPFSLFFEVEDSVFSLMDTQTLHTRHFEKHLREGNYRRDDVVAFDQERHTATYSDGTVVEVPPDVQDVLSSLYFLRTQNLEVGKTVVIQNHADKKNYPLEIRILRRETVSVPAGRFECLVVEPILKASGLFQSQGRLTVWLTNSPHFVPVMMKGRIIIGSIDAVLTDMTVTR